MREKTTVLSIRVKENYANEIRDFAQKNKCSVSNIIILAIERLFKQLKK